MEDFSYHLKKIRESRGMTVNQLAMYSGISSASISRYESGERSPKSENVKKIADALKYNYEELMKLAGHLDKKDSVEKLISYLEMELTNDEIKERLTFKVDDITLSSEEVDEFVDWVRVQRLMKKQRSVASKSEGL